MRDSFGWLGVLLPQHRHYANGTGMGECFSIGPKRMRCSGIASRRWSTRVGKELSTFATQQLSPFPGSAARLRFSAKGERKTSCSGFVINFATGVLIGPPVMG